MKCSFKAWSQENLQRSTNKQDAKTWKARIYQSLTVQTIHVRKKQNDMKRKDMKKNTLVTISTSSKRKYTF